MQSWFIELVSFDSKFLRQLLMDILQVFVIVDVWINDAILDQDVELVDGKFEFFCNLLSQMTDRLEGTDHNLDHLSVVLVDETDDINLDWLQVCHARQRCLLRL